MVDFWALKGPSWSQPHFSWWSVLTALHTEGPLISSAARGSQRRPCDPEGDVLWSIWRSRLREEGTGSEGLQKPECENTVALQILFSDSHHGLSSTNEQGCTWHERKKVHPPGHSATSPGRLEAGPANLSNLFL